MTYEKVYDDIFEAIRQLSPSCELLFLKDNNEQGNLQRNVTFDAIVMPNNKITFFPRTGLNIVFYRGEREEYPNCYPTLYRTDDEFNIMLGRLKTIDFMLIAKEFPPVYYAEKMGVNVDMLAIAQHYELPTDMLDLTSDIAVAAFFATTYYDEKRGIRVPMSSGIGRLKTHFFMPDNDFLLNGSSEFRHIGLQPFKRPGQQCAFGIQIKNGQSFENIQQGCSIRFLHNEKQNRKILNLFGKEKYNSLFPREVIADVADKIKNANCVTKAAIKKYCTQYGVDEQQIIKKLQEHQIMILDKPIYRLTKKQNERMKIEFRNKPFG